ncbi:MAG: excisionase family DNA-binding protein [bacterium]|nr:excisionase family DNA-binding protein [bacterium]
MKSKEFFTTSELAKLLGISRIAVFNKIKSGVIKAQKMGRNFVIYKKDIEILSDDLLGLAKNWVVLDKSFPQEFYCSNISVFQARLIRFEDELGQIKRLDKTFSLISAITGEMGNNSFDHNLGNWPDMPGIFFGYDLKKGIIVLADRGQGLLETLRKVKPKLASHQAALMVAFTEIISGRAPEARGNGLKFVKSVIFHNAIDLLFQTGDAQLELQGNNSEIKIQKSAINFHGCLVLIKF